MLPEAAGTGRGRIASASCRQGVEQPEGRLQLAPGEAPRLAGLGHGGVDDRRRRRPPAPRARRPTRARRSSSDSAATAGWAAAARAASSEGAGTPRRPSLTGRCCPPACSWRATRPRSPPPSRPSAPCSRCAAPPRASSARRARRPSWPARRWPPAPSPTARSRASPGWPDPPARWVAGWYLRSPAHAPAPAGVRELLQAPGEGFGPAGPRHHGDVPGGARGAAGRPGARRRLRLGPAGPGLGAPRARPGARLRPRRARARPGRARPGGGRAGGPPDCAAPRWRRSRRRRSRGGSCSPTCRRGPPRAARAPRRPAGGAVLSASPGQAPAVEAGYRALGLRVIGRRGRGGCSASPSPRREPRLARLVGPGAVRARHQPDHPLIPLYQDELRFSDTVVTLFLGCYVRGARALDAEPRPALGPGRPKRVLMVDRHAGADQVVLITEPPLCGAAGGAAIPASPRRLLRRLHAFLVNAARPGGAPSCRCSGSISIRLGSASAPGSAVDRRYADEPLRLPLRLPLLALAAAAGARGHPARDRDRALAAAADLRLEYRRSGRFFWRVLMPWGRSPRSSTGSRCR